MGLMDMLRNWQEKQKASNDNVSEFRKSRNPDTQDEVLISKRMEYKKWQEMEEKEKLKKALDEKRKEFTNKNMFGNKENSIVQDYQYRQAQAKEKSAPVAKKSYVPKPGTTRIIQGATSVKSKYVKKKSKKKNVVHGKTVGQMQYRDIQSLRVAPRPQSQPQKVNILGVNSGFIKKTENLNKSKVRVMNNGGVKVL
jgi:hypothetical protein